MHELTLRTLSALAIACAPVAAPARAPAPQPVRIDRNGPELDACASNGRVTGLKAGGDNFLSARAAPSATAREVARLGPRQEVVVCDEAPGGWYGIVWSPSGADCGLGTPGAKRYYAGPCRSGWVSGRFIDIYAG